MGEKTGCYRCGQDGHWSRSCPLSQNGSFSEGPMPSGGSGYGNLAYGGGRGFNRGYNGGPGFDGSTGFGAGPGFVGGAGFGGGPGFGRGAGFVGGPGFGRGADFGGGAGFTSGTEFTGGEAGYGVGMNYGTGGDFMGHPSGFEEGDRFGVVDYYEKYRARPYRINTFEERSMNTLLPPSSTLREHMPSTTLDPYDRSNLPTTQAALSTYYARDRSPVRRATPMAEGYTFERSRLSPVTSVGRGAPFDATRPRDPYAERPQHYAF
ncbi:RBM41 protein, partial [Polypterus senegalus]